jgi:hypothetical protein
MCTLYIAPEERHTYLNIYGFTGGRKTSLAEIRVETLVSNRMEPWQEEERKP